MSIRIVKIDYNRNRLYMEDCESYHETDVIRSAAQVIIGANGLRPGFAVIIHINSIRKISPLIDKMNGTICRFLMHKDISRCIIVTRVKVNYNSLTDSLFLGLRVERVETTEEAEQMLDGDN